MNLADVTEPGNSSGSKETFVREKVRIRFRKDGPLRFVSHNDMMRCWDRLVRRSGLPIRYTQGFHPKPKLSSPLALGVGTIGYEEILELELTESVEPAQVHQLLTEKTVEGLTILSVSLHPSKERTEVVAVEYICPVPPDVQIESIRQSIQTVLASDQWTVVRTHPTKPARKVDLRPLLRDIHVDDDKVVLQVGVVEGRTARAEELIGLLGLENHQPPVILTRSRVILAPS